MPTVPFLQTDVINASPEFNRLARLPVNQQTGTSYTPVVTDEASTVNCTNAADITVTLPQDSALALPVSGYIQFRQGGAGQIVFAAGSGATLSNAGIFQTTYPGQIVRAYKGAANTWWIADAQADGPVSVAWFGAKGNGIANDTAAFTAALATGRTIWVPEGTYLISPNTLAITTPGQSVFGAGPQLSILIKSGNGRLLDLSGSATGPSNHTKFSTIEDVGLDGGGFTGLLLRLYYAHHHTFSRVIFSGNNGVAIDTAEFFDSDFYSCMFDTCSGADGSSPCITLRNAAASSGFGSSGDNVNNIRFHGCTWESYRDGCVWIDAGFGTQNPNGIHFDGGCKMESVTARGPAIKAGNVVKDLEIHDLLVAHIGLDSGASVHRGIDIGAYGKVTIEDVQFVNLGVATFSQALYLATDNLGGVVHVDRIDGRLGTACTTALVDFSAGAVITHLGSCFTTIGPLWAASPAGPLAIHDQGWYAPTFASTLTPDLMVSDTYGQVLTGAQTVAAPLNPRPGQILTFVFIQDGTGGRVVTWNSVFKKAWTPVTTAGSVNTISFKYGAGFWFQISASVGLA